MFIQDAFVQFIALAVGYGMVHESVIVDMLVLAGKHQPKQMVLTVLTQKLHTGVVAHKCAPQHHASVVEMAVCGLMRINRGKLRGLFTLVLQAHHLYACRPPHGNLGHSVGEGRSAGQADVDQHDLGLTVLSKYKEVALLRQMSMVTMRSIDKYQRFYQLGVGF
jgi:hypothetical protein